MKRNVWYTLLLLTCTLVLVMGLCTLGAAAQEQVTEAESVLTETEAAEGATEKRLPTNEELGGFFSKQRIEYAVTVTLQGMLMIFAVLSLLWGVVAVFKVFLHDIPAKKAAKQAALAKAVAEVTAPVAEPVAEPMAEAEPEEEEGEIVAAITAAIAAMLQSEEYNGQFASGFRVVSFTRKGGAWNKQH